MTITQIEVTKEKKPNIDQLVTHFFRVEHRKMIAILSQYLGSRQVQTAEDIVQETLLAAVTSWPYRGIPQNPTAWLYTTAKNKALNIQRKRKQESAYLENHVQYDRNFIEWSEEEIADEQLRIMLQCCQAQISQESQIALILKILCGFTIAEIASAFRSNYETINKRLVRGREKLRQQNLKKIGKVDLLRYQPALLKTIYLLFTEGYYPANKDQIVRQDLCAEAISLAQLMLSSEMIKSKEEIHALLALMYLNASRFQARSGSDGEMIDMKHQDRSLWVREQINLGIYHLSAAQHNDHLSSYLVLANISANHCVAPTYDQTNWKEILGLYDVLLTLESTPIIRLNRIVALANIDGPPNAIEALQELDGLQSDHLYHATLAMLYLENEEYEKARSSYQTAISICNNDRDRRFLSKKMSELVPVSNTRLL